MPALGFSGAIMAVVAYGEVEGFDGTSPKQNSGQYKTSRVALGEYRLTPTAGNIQTEDLSQVYVQAKGASDHVVSKVDTDAITGIISISFRDLDDDEEDTDFSFIVLRSTIAPPTGSPA